jgi:hypothetical protein
MISKTAKWKSAFIVLLIITSLLRVTAQSSSVETEKLDIFKAPHVLEYLKLSNTWLDVSNPAGLSLSEMHDIGSSLLSFNYNDGNFFRPQEPERSSQLGFSTENYKLLKDLRLWGEFTFLSTNEYNRNWSVVVDPFRGTPYVFADEEGGQWKKQYYSLNAGASTKKLFDLFYFGIETNYEVHTGARQNDPRPLNNANHLWIRPGFIFPLGNRLSLGLSSYYSNRNEEISTFVVNKYFQHRLYKLRGVGEYHSVYTREFFRAYNGDAFGGGMQLEYLINNGNILVDANVRSFNEKVTDSETLTDGTSIYQSGGEYNETVIDASVTVKLSGDRYMHLMKGYFNMVPSKGIEHSQKYDNSLEKWITFATSVRYLSDRYQGGLSYSFYKSRSNSVDYNWMIGLQTFFTSTDLRFLSPKSSQLNSAVHLNVTGKKNVSFSRNNIHMSLSAGYKMSLHDELSLNPELVNSDRTTIIDNVLMPDFEYLTTDYMKMGLNVIYSFSLVKKTNNNIFIGLKADKYQLINSGMVDNVLKDGRNFLEITLGLVY